MSRQGRRKPKVSITAPQIQSKKPAYIILTFVFVPVIAIAAINLAQTGSVKLDYFRIISALLLLCSTWMVYAFSRKFITDTFASVAALIFALHPINSAGSFSISLRVDLLFLIALFGACLLYMRSLASMRRLEFYMALILAAACSLIMEIAWVMPLIILLIAVFYGGESVWNNLAGRYKRLLWFFVIAWTIGVVRAILGARSFCEPGNAINVFNSYFIHYPTMMLSPIYIDLLGEHSVLIKRVMLALGWFSFLGLLFYRKNRSVLAGFALMMISLAPLANCYKIGTYLIGIYLLSIPLVGFTFFIAAIAERLWVSEKIAGKSLFAIFIMWVLLLPVLLIFTGSAYVEASQIKSRIHDALIEKMKDMKNPGPIYLMNCPYQHKGINIYPGLMWNEDQKIAMYVTRFVSEDFLKNSSSRPTMTKAAENPGFGLLYCRGDQISDVTDDLRHALKANEGANSVQSFELNIIDKELLEWDGDPPSLEIEAYDVIPPATITKLCLDLNILNTGGGKNDGFTLTWTGENGEFSAKLFYSPDREGLNCVELEKDPRFVLAGRLAEFYVEPHPLKGRAKLSKAEVFYRTQLVEIFEELVLEPDHPLLQMMAE